MSVDTRRFAIVMNPASAGGKPGRLLARVEAALTDLGLEYRIAASGSMAHAIELAREAAAAGDVVVAFGGDGLVGGLAGAVRGAAPLGVLPGGRGNDFARHLGIPEEIEAACRVLAEGPERRLDLGEANGRPFACIASTGYDSEANRLANEARLLRGNLVYLYAALRALARWKPTRFTVTMDGEPYRFIGYTVVAANTSYYGGGMRVAPAADPADGMLDLVLVNGTSKLRFLMNISKVFSGKHVKLEEIVTRRTREVLIEADRPFTVYADGDLITELPATVRVVPGELRVLVPPG
jgi:YegS/Rv2252/BmrU family lipid kinase